MWRHVCRKVWMHTSPQLYGARYKNNTITLICTSALHVKKGVVGMEVQLRGFLTLYWSKGSVLHPGRFSPTMYKLGDTHSRSESSGNTEKSCIVIHPGRLSPTMYRLGDTHSWSESSEKTEKSCIVLHPGRLSPTMYRLGDTHSRSDSSEKTEKSYTVLHPGRLSPTMYRLGDTHSRSESSGNTEGSYTVGKQIRFHRRANCSNRASSSSVRIFCEVKLLGCWIKNMKFWRNGRQIMLLR